MPTPIDDWKRLHPNEPVDLQYIRDAYAANAAGEDVPMIQGELDEEMDTAMRLMHNVFAQESVVWMPGDIFKSSDETVVKKLPVLPRQKPSLYLGYGHGNPHIFTGRANYKGMWFKVWGMSNAEDRFPDVWIMDYEDFQGGNPARSKKEVGTD